jgi:FKBP-type peptidyl-prolyl cis-trans isomerase 2
MANAMRMVLIEYELWMKIGEKETLHRSTEKGKTIAYIVGKAEFPPQVEKAISEASAGEWFEVEQGPGDEKDPATTGTRNASLVKYFPVRQFLGVRRVDGRARMPQIGDVIGIESKPGTIIDIKASRVKVDFNPPLAGSHLRFRIRIEREVTSMKELIERIIAREYAPGTPEVKLEKEGPVVVIDASQVRDPSWDVARFRIVGALRDFEINTLKFVEEHSIPA